MVFCRQGIIDMEVELNKIELERLFDETIKNINNMHESIMFNLYEDADVYSMEATFDDEEFVICRDNPAILCSNKINYKNVIKEIRIEIKNFFETNKDILKNAKEISFGFVDGDLFYVKKAKKAMREFKKFTIEDFKDFDSTRLLCWISAYMTDEAKDEYKPPLLARKMSRLKMKKWKRLLVENFDYKKYNSKY